MKILTKIVVNGLSVRVVETSEGEEYQAQAKDKFMSRFRDTGPRCQTQDGACYWALRCVEAFGQDKERDK